MRAAEDEGRRLRGRVAAAAAAASPGSPGGDRDELARMHKNYTELLHAMQAKEREADAVQRQLDEAERRLRDLELAAKYRADRAGDASAGQAAVITELQESLVVAETAAKALVADVEAHVALGSQLRHENEALQAAKHAAEAAETAAACKAAELETRLRHADEAHAARLRKLKEDQKAELHAMQTRAAEAQEGLAEAQRSLRACQRQADTAGWERHGARGREGSAADEARREAASLRGELEAATGDLQAERSRARQLDSELRSAKRGLEQHREVTYRLRSELSEAETVLATAERGKASLEQCLREAKEAHAAEAREVRAARDAEAARSREAEAARAELEDERGALRRDAEALRGSVHALQLSGGRGSAKGVSDAVARQGLADEVRLLQARQKGLVAEVEEARRDARAAAAQAARAGDEERRAREALEDVEQRYRSLRLTYASSAAAAEKLELDKMSAAEAQGDVRYSRRGAGGGGYLSVDRTRSPATAASSRLASPRYT